GGGAGVPLPTPIPPGGGGSSTFGDWQSCIENADNDYADCKADADMALDACTTAVNRATLASAGIGGGGAFAGGRWGTDPPAGKTPILTLVALLAVLIPGSINRHGCSV